MGQTKKFTDHKWVIGLWVFNPLSENVVVIMWWQILYVEVTRVPREHETSLSVEFEPSSTKFYLIDGGNWRKPLTCRKSLTNLMLY